MKRARAHFHAGLLCAAVFGNVAAAKAEPTSVGFLSPAEEGDEELRALRETAWSALKRKSISVEAVSLECSPDAECMRNALRDAGVEVGVYLWVWKATRDRPGPVVGVMFKEADGVAGFDEVAEERSCSASSCEGVVEALVHQLLERWPERRGTRLRLTGTPPGATVFDGASLVGTMPGDFQLSRGEHRLRIASKGYEPGVLLVTAGPTPEEARRVDLIPLSASEEPVDGARRPRRAAMIASGVALLAGGGALIGIGAASYARSGSCDGTTPCQSYTTSNAGAGVMLGVGIASAGGGLALLIKGIRDRK
jgi:hypothetical protein